MLESVEKLRNWATRPDGGFWRPEIESFCNAIECENAKQYIKLPLDAVGVVWKHTDNTFIDKDGYEHTLVSMKVDRTGKWILCSYGTCYQACECHHVKPRTVEDVLRELTKSGTPTGEGGVMYETALIEKYAYELRKILNGDAE